jgi:hypothetical protein
MAKIDRKPPEFYSKNVKNLWISALGHPNAFHCILSVCSGVENLVYLPHGQFNIPFTPLFALGRHVRRLTSRLRTLFPLQATMLWENFQHPYFANLTHLHLCDEEDWFTNFTFVRFENFRSLTHLAFARCYPQHLAIVMPKLPALEYVAIGSCNWVDCVPCSIRLFHVGVYYGIRDPFRVVCVESLTLDDWERGVTGMGDFWDVVEREVARRQAVMVRVLSHRRKKLSSTSAGH